MNSTELVGVMSQYARAAKSGRALEALLCLWQSGLSLTQAVEFAGDDIPELRHAVVQRAPAPRRWDTYTFTIS